MQIAIPDVAKPLAREVYRQVLKSGAHPLLRLIPTGFDRDFYQLANQDQLNFFPQKYLRAKANTIDHSIAIIADVNPQELVGIDPQKIMRVGAKQKPYRDWLTKKENAGQFTWTVGLWPTLAKAKMVGLSKDEYWQQIIKACYLDEKDPVAKWREISKLQQEIIQKLNKLKIEEVLVQGVDVDLKIKIGQNRKWIGGSGRNMPSFEVFTSPDWREAEGWIRCNQPLYRYGNIIQDIFLKLKDGIIVEAKASKGNDVLQAMIAVKNANKLGEFSLTDKRLSRITHPMAETLFDENMGGEFGNTHIAVGMSYRDTFAGDPNIVTESEWKNMGFNDSSVHTDVVSTTDRTVTATLKDSSKVIIYKDGQFL